MAPAVSDPWAFADAAATQGEFLSLFPNPENLALPELMLLKGRLMGLPAIAIWGYVIAVLIIILTGVFGLKRYTSATGSKAVIQDYDERDYDGSYVASKPVS